MNGFHTGYIAFRLGLCPTLCNLYRQDTLNMMQSFKPAAGQSKKHMYNLRWHFPNEKTCRAYVMRKHVGLTCNSKQQTVRVKLASAQVCACYCCGFAL